MPDAQWLQPAGRVHRKPRPPASVVSASSRQSADESLARSGPPRLRAHRNSANLLRSHRPRYPPALAVPRYLRPFSRMASSSDAGGFALAGSSSHSGWKARRCVGPECARNPARWLDRLVNCGVNRRVLPRFKSSRLDYCSGIGLMLGWRIVLIRRRILSPTIPGGISFVKTLQRTANPPNTGEGSQSSPAGAAERPLNHE